MRFPAKITSSCIWVAIPVDWVILHWFAFGADGWVGTLADGHLITKFYRMGRLLHFLKYGATLRTLRSREPRYGTHNWSLQNTAQFLIRVPDSKIESKCNFRLKNLILESRLSLPSLVPTVFFENRENMFWIHEAVLKNAIHRWQGSLYLLHHSSRYATADFTFGGLSYDALRGPLTVLCTSLVRLALYE